MYLMSIDVYMRHVSVARDSLHDAPDVQAAIEGFLARMVEFYVGEDVEPNLGVFSGRFRIGCGAPDDPDLRDALATRLGMFVDVMAGEMARRKPDVPAERIRVAAEQVSATLHSLAVRARAGEGRDTLLSFARQSAKLVAGYLDQGGR